MILTTFETKNSKGKAPLSPYDDLTFDFKTVETDKLSSAYRLMVTGFVLNLPLNTNVRTFRRKTYLKNYYNDTFDYVILDINEVKDENSKSNILKYFKNYKCIIGESRSYNGVDNYNLKGILCIQPLTLNNLKILVNQIHDDLECYCNLDTSTTRLATLTAPIGKYSVFIDNYKGAPYNFVYRPLYNSKRLTKILNNDFVVPKINIDNVVSIEDYCLKTFHQMGFEAIKENNDCIVFKHPSEQKTIGGYFWFKDSPFIMHHYNENKSINIFNDVKSLPEVKKFLDKKIDYNDALQTSLKYNTIVVNDAMLSVTKTIQQCIQTFLYTKDGVIAIKSPMATGKSVIIKEIIKNALDVDLRILVCTNRISVAEDFKNKYNLKIYNLDRYKLGDSIIVQYDSLWKYNTRNFDVVIFDEFTSLLLHSRNSLNNTLQNFAKFFACFNKKIVIADAFLTGFEDVFLKTKTQAWLIDNTYREDIKTYCYSDYNCFVQSIVVHAKKHKITISCTSLNNIYALKYLLEKYGLKIVTLTADTPQCTKKLIYNEFANFNCAYDVLIYSPTLTVGVSILNNIKYHFHYDNSNTVNVISSLQMIRRSRNAKEIHFYVKNKINYVKTTYKEIKDDYTENLNKDYNLNGLFTVTKYGDLRLSDLGEKAVYIDQFKNIIEYNHKDAFMFLLSYQFKNAPTIIDKKFESNILLPYINQVKNDTEKFREACLNEYLSLSKIDDCFDHKKENIFELLDEIETNLVPGCPLEVKNAIFKKILSNYDYINIIRRYKIIKTFDKTKIKNIISDCLTKNKNDLAIWNTVLKYDKIEHEYLYNTIDNKLKKVLDLCGYKLYNTNGLKLYKIDNEILEFEKWLR